MAVNAHGVDPTYEAYCADADPPHFVETTAKAPPSAPIAPSVSTTTASEDLAIQSMPLESLPNELEDVELFIRMNEEKLAPARVYAQEIRNEIARRLDAEQATMMRIGEHSARFDRVAPKAVVRESMLLEPGVIDEIRSVMPGDVFAKAVMVRDVPARVEVKTHLTFFKKLLDCGEKGKALYARLVDPGKPGRRLVIEREQQAVEPTAIGGAA